MMILITDAAGPRIINRRKILTVNEALLFKLFLHVKRITRASCFVCFLWGVKQVDAYECM